MEDLNMKKVQQILESAKNVNLPTSAPFMKTRVLAILEERKNAKKMLFWKWIGFLSPVASVVAFVLFTYVSTPTFTADIMQPVMVKVELKQASDIEVAFAEIELPEGVFFYSAKFPELKDKRSIRVAWSALKANELPLVVSSNHTGKKTIQINLKGQDENKVGEKKIQILFKG